MQFPWMPALSRSRPPAPAASATAVAASASGSAVAPQLDREHGAEAAHVHDAVEALPPRLHAGADRLADLLGAVREALLGDDVENGVGGGDRHGVADVRAAHGAVGRGVHDLRPPEHARERQARGDRLGDDDQVRLDPEVLHRERAPGAAETCLHLVGHEDDPVLVADPAEALHELGRRHDEAALALDRLEDDARRPPPPPHAS